MNLAEHILKKHALRSDALWTSRLLYRAPFKQIPIRLDTWALLRSQYWERSMLDALQDARIAELLRAAARVPFWRERFAQAGVDLEGNLGRETLGRLPVTSKKDFFDRPVEEYTDLPGNPVHWFDRTSGSTGLSLRFPLDAHHMLRFGAIEERKFRTAGHGTRLPIVSIRARFRPVDNTKRKIRFQIKNVDDLPARLPALQELLVSFPDGALVHALTSTLIELSRLVDERSIRLPVRGVVTLGEGLPPSYREHVERALGPVYESYGTGETSTIAVGCERSRFHITEEWLSVEIIDDSGAPVPFGKEGRIIVTTFDNLVMPFIRYDTGDLGTIDEEPCPCGRSLHVLRLSGRAVEMIRLPEGRSVSLKDVLSVFGRYWRAARQYQIVQQDEARFIVNVIPGPSFQEERDALSAALVRMLGGKAQLEVQTVEAIPEGPNGKASYFVRASPV